MCLNKLVKSVAFLVVFLTWHSSSQAQTVDENIKSLFDTAKILQEAQTNPKGFFDKLSEENKNKIFDLTVDLNKEARNPANVTP